MPELQRDTQKICGPRLGLDQDLSFALQFSSISGDQRNQLLAAADLPSSISAVTNSFEGRLSPEIINDSRYAYRVAFVERLANRPRTADQVIEFVRPDSAEGKAISRVLIKETERKKFKPHQIVQMMQTEGYPRFLIHHHINLWKERSARPSPFGVFLK